MSAPAGLPRGQSRSWRAFLFDPFRSGYGFDIRIVLAFVVINGLVLLNAVLHDPRIGYDAVEHLECIHPLSELRLVTPADSSEFFSPPLPYALPALFMGITGMDTYESARVAQGFQVLLSLGLTLMLLKTCQVISPSPSFRLGTLVFLGMLPVYYKTFAFVRGEPYVALFAIIVAYLSLKVLTTGRFTMASAVGIGVALGLAALSRQWGLMLVPPVLGVAAYQWFRLPSRRWTISATGVCMAVALVVGGWFYVALHMKYGSSLAFNRRPTASFSLHNQPARFYFGVSPVALFTAPLRSSFANEFVPIFYSEMWGDYWGYFFIYGRDTRTSQLLDGYALGQVLRQYGGVPPWLETNYSSAAAYLGRVNLVSLFPSVVALASLLAAVAVVARKRDGGEAEAQHRAAFAFLLFAIATSLAGFAWFLVRYPSPGKGDTIKATYMLHLYPFVAILVGAALERVRGYSPGYYRVVVGGLGVSFLHNLPAMVTRFHAL